MADSHAHPHTHTHSRPLIETLRKNVAKEDAEEEEERSFPLPVGYEREIDPGDSD